MKILEQGRNLNDDTFVGNCSRCKCKFECEYKELHKFFGGDAYHECPNCKQLTGMKIVEQVNPKL